jgi:hypothetical protein
MAENLLVGALALRNDGAAIRRGGKYLVTINRRFLRLR